MSTVLIRQPEGKLPVVESPPRPTPTRPRLVARWLKDENSRLYCQWVQE